MSAPFIKHVIQFSDGSYWRAYELLTQDINEAWTFNRDVGAHETARRNDLKDYTVRAVNVSIVRGQGFQISLVE
jgi:hypothetical protein